MEESGQKVKTPRYKIYRYQGCKFNMMTIINTVVIYLIVARESG